MIFIADGGSTKVDWRIIDAKGLQTKATTIGFNPFYYSSEDIEKELRKSFAIKQPVRQALKVFFYGSGCSDDFRCNIVQKGLLPIFPNALVTVTHDLLAAARATCFDQPGIICILGTGSNSGLYDGHQITDNIPSLGYLLGDEASGSYLGRALIQGYFYREMPKDIEDLFEDRYKIGKRELLNKIYGDPHANVYLASFARFLSDNRHHPYIIEIVRKSFLEFIDRHISKYKNFEKLPIHFVGSVALYFSHVLQQLMEERNLELGIITNKPIDNLVTYHLKTENLVRK